MQHKTVALPPVTEPAVIKQAINKFLQAHPRPTLNEAIAFGDEFIVEETLAHGVDAEEIYAALEKSVVESNQVH